MAESYSGDPLVDAKLTRRGRCLVYTGALCGGYGIINRKGRMFRVHRLVYAHRVGPIPPGLHVLHTCDNPPCCEERHLYAGTRSQNMRDMVRRKLRLHFNAKKRECIHGHPFTPANTYVDKIGKRHCRECNRIRAEKRR